MRNPDRNVAAILRVADAIEKAELAASGIGFNMCVFNTDPGAEYEYKDHTGHNCGSVACIAGWAEILLANQSPKNACTFRLSEHFAISVLDASNIVMGGAQTSLDAITDTQAVAMLHHLAATGEVKW